MNQGRFVTRSISPYNPVRDLFLPGATASSADHTVLSFGSRRSLHDTREVLLVFPQTIQYLNL